MPVTKLPMEQKDQVALLESLRAKGRDPASTVSCAPGTGEKFALPGVAGCPHYYTCIFNQKRYGGFKGAGRDHLPHNVVYEYKPNDGTNHQKEDEMSCHAFMQTRMRAMMAGRTAIEQNEPGEVINIIGGEGDEYLWGFFGKDPKHTPQNDPLIPFMDQTITKICQPYQPNYGSRDNSYESQLEKRRKERQKAAEDPNDTPLPKRRLSPNDPAPKTAKELEAELAKVKP